MPDNNTPWPRLIAFTDMNAFFASIEQLDNPDYRGKPIGVTNGRTGACIITCSYEARALGIHTTMRLKQARALCPGFIQVPARKYFIGLRTRNGWIGSNWLRGLFLRPKRGF